MKKVLFFLLLFSVTYGYAQQAFIKEIEFQQTSDPVILGTPDKGWIIYLSNETQIFKYDQCGQQEWVKDYVISNNNCCIGNPIALLPNGNIGILTRIELGAVFGYQLSVIDPNGEPVWSKVYSQSGSDYFPYSLTVGEDGSFLVYGIESPVGGGSGFLNLIKVASDGQTVWSKKIQNGFIWGATIATSDSGYLARSGDKFVKMDIDGNFEWASNITASFAYNYLAPVEVSDGYIFTKSRNGSNEVGFFKMDKQGSNMWPLAKFTNFQGRPLALTPLSNGNFTAIFNDSPQGGVYGFVIIEFDKDLNVIKQSKILHNRDDLFITDFSVSQNGFPLVVGKLSVPIQNVFFAKLDANYIVGCNDIVHLTWTDEIVSSLAVTATIISDNITETNMPLSYTNFTFTDEILCKNIIIVPNLQLENDVEKCTSDSMVLKDINNANFELYRWSTGETTSQITITQPGKYWVEGGFVCVNQTSSDTIIVTDVVIENPNLITDTVMCSDKSIVLDVEIIGGSYLWQDNSTKPTFEVTEPGNFYVDITFKNCTERFSSRILSCEDFLIPNIFTPNNDGINDYFGLVYDGNQDVKVEVFNRWGVLVFKSDIKGFNWDGTLGGEKAPAGVYFYVIKIGADKYQGPLTLIR